MASQSSKVKTYIYLPIKTHNELLAFMDDEDIPDKTEAVRRLIRAGFKAIRGPVFEDEE